MNNSVNATAMIISGIRIVGWIAGPPSFTTEAGWCSVFHQSTDHLMIGMLMAPTSVRIATARPARDGSSTVCHNAITPRYIRNRISGTFRATAQTDGVSRFYAFTRVGSLPLIVTVGLSEAEVFAAWWDKITMLSVVYLLMAVSILALVGLFTSELRRRETAELAQAALARQDNLTGLANRRGFSEAFDSEWQRAARERGPLSLVMIDIDHFKALNDTQGHATGDAVLRLLVASTAGSDAAHALLVGAGASALGVMAISGVGSVAASLGDGLSREGRTLLDALSPAPAAVALAILVGVGALALLRTGPVLPDLRAPSGSRLGLEIEPGDALFGGGQPLHHRPAVVAGAIVDQDDLIILAHRRARRTRDARVQHVEAGGFVIAGNDDGQGGALHDAAGLAASKPSVTHSRRA